MAIGDRKKAKPAVQEKTEKVLTPSQKMFAAASSKTSKVNLYVKDSTLLTEMKMAAIDDETSLSALFEEWGAAWLDQRRSNEK